MKGFLSLVAAVSLAALTGLAFYKAFGPVGFAIALPIGFVIGAGVGVLTYEWTRS